MIIAKLIGGLGNQMFQYAVARHLALINSTNLKIDVSEYENYDLHDYALHHFQILEEVASASDLLSVSGYKEKHFHFDENFREIGNNILLTGYWQSSKYFEDISELIHSEFHVQSDMSGKDLEVSKQILASNSVSLHIRRSDYTPESYKDQIFDSLSLNYYRKAVADLQEKECKLNLFVFSDDINWARENVTFDLPIEFVDHNDSATNFQDLRLMSLCRHNIIANSSFSWWGAWLNRNENKRVYAPSEWFNSNVRNLDPRDIIPDTWIKI